MTEDTGWLCWQTQVVPRSWVFTGGWGGEEREGGSSAARRWIRRRRVAASCASPDAGKRPRRRIAERPWCSSSLSSPAIRVRRRLWRFHVFSWLIFRAVGPFVSSQGDTQFAALWRETLWNFQLQSGWVLTLFITISSEWIYRHASPRCCLG